MRLATIVLIIREGTVLLGRKQGAPEIGVGTLNGAGGKMEPEDEGSVIKTCVRETKEELGIDLDPACLEKVAVVTFYAGTAPNMEVHIFRTETYSGEPRETEHMVPEWHPIAQIPYERMLEADRHWFPELFKGRKFRTNVFYQEKAKGFLYVDPPMPLEE